MDQDEKVRENHCRRMAERQGCLLQKSRRRDPNALDFGTYQLVDAATNGVVFADWHARGGFGLGLDDVEAWLTKSDKRPAPPRRVMAPKKEMVPRSRRLYQAGITTLEGAIECMGCITTDTLAGRIGIAESKQMAREVSRQAKEIAKALPKPRAARKGRR